jgi:hypothetical protein
MEQVEFITVESGEDLIVSFVILRDDGEDIRSITLMRTPICEQFLDEDERGVSVSDDDSEEDNEDNNDLLEEILFRGEKVQLVTRDACYNLNCCRVDETEYAAARDTIAAMNFDKRFRIQHQ